MRYRDASAPIPERVADLLSRMTRIEKIAQLSQHFVTPQTREQMKARVRADGLGSRIHSDTNLAGSETGRALEVDELNDFQRVAVEETRLGIPLLHGRDIIHGHRTVFPIPLGLAAAFNPDLVEAAYAVAAREARSAGVHWTFAPMLDIARDPRWGRLVEGWGEDPYLGARLATAAVLGLQGRERGPEGQYAGERLMACAKHYVGYGGAEGGRDYNTAEITDNTLRNIYLPPFRAAVQAGVGSVMSAFQDVNGEPATGSRYLLTDLLRGELGFDGFVISDWGSISDLITHRVAADRRAAAQIAFAAGVDMDMAADCYRDHLAELIDSGALTEAQLDAACARILTTKFQLGLFEQPYTDPAAAARVQFTAENRAVARQAARQSLVLLENDGVLPLKPAGRIAVVGPLADERRTLMGTWVQDGLIHETATVLEMVRAACPEAEVRHTPGWLLDEVLVTAARADVVILVVGESNHRTGEDASVASLDLPAGQDALIEAVGALGKPVVLVVLAGRPVLLARARKHVNAVLYGWHPGTEGAGAIADVLFGQAAPSGKLPVSFPRVTGQVPIHYNYKSTGRWQRYVDVPVTPLYPFGYGLSYTTFGYSDLALSAARFSRGEAVTVDVTVTNTGQRPGEEVAQCYLQDCVSSATRPVRELKGFARVALQPGASRRLSFTLGPDELGYFGPGGRWLVEPGQFKVWVGGDSRASLEGTFEVV